MINREAEVPNLQPPLRRGLWSAWPIYYLGTEIRISPPRKVRKSGDQCPEALAVQQGHSRTCPFENRTFEARLYNVNVYICEGLIKKDLNLKPTDIYLLAPPVYQILC